MTIILTSTITLIIGFFIGKKTHPKPVETKEDSKEVSACRAEIAILKSTITENSKTYTELRRKHNKLIDLVSEALNNKKKKTEG